jgi:hypothetical protein
MSAEKADHRARNSRVESFAYIVVGPINAINGLLEDRNNIPCLVYIEVPHELFVHDDNTVYIKRSQLTKPLRVFVKHNNELLAIKTKIKFEKLFNGMSFRPDFLSKFFSITSEEIISFVPLFYISVKEDLHNTAAPTGRNVSLYSQLRYSETDIIFIRTGYIEGHRDPHSEGQLPGNAVADFMQHELSGGERVVKKCMELHEKNSVFLGNHQCYYAKMQPLDEIEYKFNITSSVSIWGLTVQVYDEFKNGGCRGFIHEYKDEFQKWDYYNYLFEVLSPPEEVGYISFIPRTDGRFNIKRKIYPKDQLIRKELIKSSVAVDGTFEEYLDKNYNFQYRALPRFRRVRYDVNMESLHTGNVFGIFFDNVSIENCDVSLVQCEIEYLRTRSLFANDKYIHELDYLRDWTIDFLRRANVTYQETFESKLSFLRRITDLANRPAKKNSVESSIPA